MCSATAILHATRALVRAAVGHVVRIPLWRITLESTIRRPDKGVADASPAGDASATPLSGRRMVLSKVIRHKGILTTCPTAARTRARVACSIAVAEHMTTQQAHVTTTAPRRTGWVVGGSCVFLCEECRCAQSELLSQHSSSVRGSRSAASPDGPRLANSNVLVPLVAALHPQLAFLNGVHAINEVWYAALDALRPLVFQVSA